MIASTIGSGNICLDVETLATLAAKLDGYVRTAVGSGKVPSIKRYRRELTSIVKHRSRSSPAIDGVS